MNLRKIKRRACKKLASTVSVTLNIDAESLAYMKQRYPRNWRGKIVEVIKMAAIVTRIKIQRPEVIRESMPVL